jgi:uncharacterized protein YabE (DUF348 family)
VTGFESTTPVQKKPDEHPARPPRRRRRLLVAGVAAAALVAGGGTAAFAAAHKTVTLDVDGRVTQVSTFAGSVEGLLDAQGVRLSERDLVSPGPGSPLADGGDVVVRFGRQLTLEADGGQNKVWVAALDAGDALSRLADRGDDVRLVASRSGDRVSLPIRLAAGGGAVEVRADGQSRTVTDAGDGVEAVLAAAGVTVDQDDRVGVEPVRGAKADVAVVVQRVVTQAVTTEAARPFATVQQEDPKRYKDLDPAVVQAGVDGVHTRVERVTTVDGVETERVLVSEADTTAPVDEIVAVGTRERPAPAPAPSAPAPAPSTQAAAASSGETPAPATPSGDVWAQLAQCESGGRVDAVSSNGLYYGLYQFTVGTWQAMGGSGLPSQASAEEQTQRAQALQARSGWGQWPACARKLGLL